MRIGIDIDDTITKSTEEIDKYAKEYTENILKRNFEPKSDNITDPRWSKYVYSWNEEEDKKFWDLYYEKFIENVKPKENAIEVINKLSKTNDIIIITARWTVKSGIISEITENWLKKYCINYTKLYLGHKDKRKIAKENNIDIFIDDNIKTCKELHDEGIKTYIMDSRLNHSMDVGDIERVYSWKEILSKLEEK